MPCSPPVHGELKKVYLTSRLGMKHCRADRVRLIYRLIHMTCADLWVWVCNMHSLQLPRAGGCSQVEGSLAVLLCRDRFLGPVQTCIQALPYFLR